MRFPFIVSAAVMGWMVGAFLIAETKPKNTYLYKYYAPEEDADYISSLFSLSNSLLIGLSLAIVYVLIMIYIKKKNYESTVYDIYEDRIELQEGYFTSHKKIIPYKDVREISVRRGILQNIWGVGSIYIATAASGAVSSSYYSGTGGNLSAASGLIIRDIDYSEAVYKTLQDLLKKAPGSTAGA